MRKTYSILVLVLQVVMMVVVALSPFLERRPRGLLAPSLSPPLIASVICGAVGVFFCWWALLSMNKNFTVFATPKAGGALVTSGAFRYSRNPMYFGLLLLGFSWALFCANWFTALGNVILGIVLLLKIYVEESALLSRFGADFISYKARTRRLIPFLI